MRGNSFLISLIILTLSFISSSCSCPSGQVRNDFQACVNQGLMIPSPSPSPGPEPEPEPEPSPIVLPSIEENISTGERILIKGNKNKFMEDGIVFFQQGDYKNAKQEFSKAKLATNPEPLIYKNNSAANLQNKAPFRIAVTVPIASNINNAEEILRGVAQAQQEYNQRQEGTGNRLLEVVIANDGLVGKKAQEEEAMLRNIAEYLANDLSILGIVGHNSSKATSIGLETYEKYSLATLSPTSTSVNLSNEVFFRLSPSDEISARKLSCHARSIHGKEVSAFVFYDSNSDYSESFKEQFKFSLGENSFVFDKNMSAQDFDVDSALQLAYERDVDVILLVPGANSSELAINVAITHRRNADYANSISLLGGDSLYGKEKLENGADSLEGLVIPVSWFSEVASSKLFYEKGLKQWKGGKVNWRTAMSYDATRALLQAFSQSLDVSRPQVISDLKNVRVVDSETSGSPLRFDYKGNRELEPVLIKVEPDINASSSSEPKYVLLDSPCNQL